MVGPLSYIGGKHRLAKRIIEIFPKHTTYEHLNTLQELLPKVTKVLTIGWRAKEQHFLKMLEGIQNARSLMVVASGEQEAREIAAQLEGTPRRFVIIHAATGGFSDTILSGELDNFLRD